MNDTTFINILLADDDKDDCLFFKDAILELKLPVHLTIVNDGEQLMKFLFSAQNLPHMLFLDLNMPRKNGFECLTEIKSHLIFKDLPVVIYSTSYDKEKADLLYNTGAQYYICKPSDFEELKNVISKAFMLVKENNTQPKKENFFINKLKIAL